MSALAAHGDLTPELTTCPLSCVVEAYGAVHAGTVTGRAVVTSD